MFCSICGNPMLDSARFCSKCGTPVIGKDSPQQPYPTGNPAQQYTYSSPTGGQSTPEQSFINFGEIKNNVQKVLDSVTGDTGEPAITFKQLFSEVFQKHKKEDLDDLLVSGTYLTKQNDAEWKKPWLFFRVFIVLGLSFLILYLCYDFYPQNAVRMIPGMVFMGALTIPASLMIFFWETNEPKHISLFDIIKIFFVGGALSLLLTFIISSIIQALSLDTSVGGHLISALFVGITEETAKLIAVYFFTRKLKDNWILGGLLIGATVGTGFAVFETAGYALMDSNSVEAMRTIIFQRGILSVGGHVVWSAIAGAALMVVQTGGVINRQNLFAAPFLRLFSVSVGLHFLWDFVCFSLSNQTVLWILLIVLCTISWVFIVKLINRGLKEFKQRKPVEPAVVSD